MNLAVDYSPLIEPPFRDPNLKPDAQAIHAFAVTNRWEYFIGTGAQPFPGVVFRDARGRPRAVQRAGNIVRIPGPPEVEIGNSAYNVTVNLNQFSVAWGYLAVRLDSVLPALLVESATARARTPLPASLEQAAELTLGAPGAQVVAQVDASASVWARAVFNPALCAMLDDERVPFNVEITGEWLFLYSPGELSTADPGVWQRLFQVLSAVQAALRSVPTPTPPAQTRVAGVPRSRLRDRPWTAVRGKVFAVYGSALGIFVLFMLGVIILTSR